MRLSMNILCDWLSKYDPKAGINQGGRVIRNVRPFSDEHMCTENNVYVSTLDIDGSAGVMCTNRNDFIFLHTDDENQVINDIMDAFDFYNAWSDGLYGMLNEASPEGLLAESRGVLPGYLMIADPAYFVLAASDSSRIPEGDFVLYEARESHIMDMEYIINIEKDPHTRMFQKKAYRYKETGLPTNPSVRNLFAGGRHIGWLIYVSENITPGAMDTEDELGDIIEAWTDINTDYRARLDKNAVFYDIFSENEIDSNKLRAALMLSGVSEGDEKMLYCTQAPERLSGFALLERADEISASARNLVIDSDLVSIFFGPEDKRAVFEERLGRIIAQTGSVCGASPSFYDLLSLPEQLEHAKASIEFKEVTGDSQAIVHFEKAALYQTGKILKGRTGKWVIHPAIPRLEEYDKKNNTEFLPTLKAYIECDRSFAKTARKLNMHRNTLLYRIGRIEEIARTDFDNPYERLHLELSFLITED